MLKLLIVDDEEWIVEGIKRMLSWKKLGIEVMQEARNGEEAILRIKEETPDIILTDIRMPKVDGLELAEYVSVEIPDLEVLIISGYADFNYAKKAMEFGVSAYITKPIERDELLENIKNAIKRIEDKRKIKKEAELNKLEHRNRELSEFYLKEDKKENMPEDKNEKHYLTSVFKVYELKSKISTPEDSNTQFQRLVAGAQRDDKHGIFFQNQNVRNQYVFIIDFPKTSQKEIILEYFRKDLEVLLQKVRNEMEIQTVIGISDIYENSSLNFQAYLQAKFIVENVKKTENSQIITKDQFDMYYSNISINEKKIEEMLLAVEFGNRKQVKALFDDAIKECGRERNLLIQLRMTIQEVLIQLSRLLQKYGGNMYQLSNKYVDIFNRIWQITNMQELSEECYILLEDAMEFICTIKDEGKESTIVQIRKYLDKHYEEPITLNSMAEKYYLNSAYLSRAFKREAGINFNDYLKKLRLQKAVVLLKTTEMKTYEIAEAVGYDNVNYFLKKFKEEYGVTPSQYSQSWIKPVL